MPKPLEVRRLGVVPYQHALDLQRTLVEERRGGLVPDVLLLLQHPPVITLGVKGDGGRSNVVATGSLLTERGIEICETGRGGDVTYHGPGQIVGYPILDLRPDRCDVHRYVRDLEEVMIRACGHYDLVAERCDGMTGAWLAEDKIGAIGVRLSRWITSHGFAFNVGTDLAEFELIVPCGIRNRGVTSLERAVGREVQVAAVEDVIVARFCEVFGREAYEPAAARRKDRKLSELDE